MNKNELRNKAINKLVFLLDKYKDDYDLPFDNVNIEFYKDEF